MSASEYPEIVLQYLKAQGWNTNITEIKQGAYVIAGSLESDSGSESMLLMIVCKPENKVMAEHLQYLLKTGREKDVDSVRLTHTVEITEKARDISNKNGVIVLDSENVRSHSENNGFDIGADEISMPNSGSESRLDTQAEPEVRAESIDKYVGDKIAISCAIGGVIGIISFAFPYVEGYNLFELMTIGEILLHKPLIVWIILVSAVLGPFMSTSTYFHNIAWIAEWGGLLQGFAGISIVIISGYSANFPGADIVVSVLGPAAIVPATPNVGVYILCSGALISIISHDLFHKEQIF